MIDRVPKNVGNFIWTTLLGELLIDDKIANLFEKNNISGYTLKPVTIDKNDKNYKLWEFVVTGWAGVASEKSGIKLKSSCDYCGDITYTSFKNPKYLIDENRWDGSDFFMVWPLPRYKFISSKVARIIKEENLKGSIISLVEDIEVDNSVIDNLSPGRLSMYMPAKRAKVLGEPLGIY
jgi:hypothetical protein